MTATNETPTTASKGTAQLLTTTSGRLKDDTGGTTTVEGHPTGSRPAQPGEQGRTSISRDLFVASPKSTTPAEDDFQAGFRKLDHDDARSVASATAFADAAIPSAAAAGEGCNQSQSSPAAAAQSSSSDRAAAAAAAAKVGSFTGEAVSSSRAAGRGDIARRSYERIEIESKCK